MSVYADRSDDAANQGDIFEDAPFALYRRLDGEPSMGMIISHDCDCDKFLKPRTPIPDEERHVWPITVAPVHPIIELDGGRAKATRMGEMHRYFYLPADENEVELVADLWLVQPVSIEALLMCDRLHSLSDEWRARLHAQIIRLRTGRSIEAIARAMGGQP